MVTSQHFFHTIIRLTIFFAMFIISPHFIFGQTLNLPESAQIKLYPEYPSPHSEVTASLEAYTYNLSGAEIRWFIDGTELAAERNNKEITFMAGPKQTKQTLGVVINFPSGESVRAQTEMSPARVDIIIEADTTAPIFYQGRRLPSSDSMVRAIAIADTPTSPSLLHYTWRINNQVLFGGGRGGQDTAEFAIPYGGDALVSVEVADNKGNVFAKNAVEFTTINPFTHFYEFNPLRGISRLTLKDSQPMVGEEISIRAEPYHMNSSIFQSDHLAEWKVNGQKVETNNAIPQVLTLRREAGSGRFRIDFHLRNLNNLLQGTRSDLEMVY